MLSVLRAPTWPLFQALSPVLPMATKSAVSRCPLACC